MTEYGLQPSYIKFDYSSSYAPHSQTLPTLQWIVTSITGGMGSYENWVGTPVDAEAMIDAYVAAAKELFPTTTSYDLATIYNYDSGAGIFIPVATKALAVAGTAGVASPNKAFSLTLNMRTTGGHTLKNVFLDYVVGAIELNKLSPLDFSADMNGVVAVLKSTAWAWAGRDNTRPNAPISATYDLNDALQKQYRMT